MPPVFSIGNLLKPTSLQGVKRRERLIILMIVIIIMLLLIKIIVIREAGFGVLAPSRKLCVQAWAQAPPTSGEVTSGGLPGLPLGGEVSLGAVTAGSSEGTPNETPTRRSGRLLDQCRSGVCPAAPYH